MLRWKLTLQLVSNRNDRLSFLFSRRRHENKLLCNYEKTCVMTGEKRKVSVVT